MVAAALAACAAAAPASGRSVIADDRFLAGPVLSGAGVAWVDGPADGEGAVRARRMDAGGSIRTLHQFDAMLNRPEPDDEYISVDRNIAIAASASHVLVTLDESQEVEEGEPYSFETWYQVRAARFSGPGRDLRVCPRGSEQESWAVLDGAIAAWLDAPCGRLRTSIRVTDLRSGAARTIAPPRGRFFDDVAIAGRYVLGHEVRDPEDARGAAVAVHDRRTGARLLHFAGEGGIGPILGAYDVARDGTVVAAYDRDRRDGVAGCDEQEAVVRLSPRRPAPERLDISPCLVGPLFVGGWIAYDRFVGHAAGQPAERQAISQLVARDPDGGPERPLVEPLTGSAFVEAAGRHALVTVPACAGTRRGTLLPVAGLLARRPLRAERCPGEIAGPDSVAVDATGRLAVRVSCPRGCYGRLALHVPSEARDLRFENESAEGAAPIELPRGSRSVVEREQLRPEEVEAIRRAGGLDAEARLTIPQHLGRDTVTTRKLRLVLAS